MRTIVVAYDGAAPADAALERARGLLATAGVRHRLLSGAGQPADEIVASARVHGSVSEDVSRNASCDVLVVRRPPAAARCAR